MIEDIINMGLYYNCFKDGQKKLICDILNSMDLTNVPLPVLESIKSKYGLMYSRILGWNYCR